MINPEAGEVSYSIIGTTEYMAPEILNAKVGKRGYDLGVDWWALGCLVYELMIGIPPFFHQNQHKMSKMIRKKEFKFPPDLESQGITVSEEARDLIA